MIAIRNVRNQCVRLGLIGLGALSLAHCASNEEGREDGAPTHRAGPTTKTVAKAFVLPSLVRASSLAVGDPQLAAMLSPQIDGWKLEEQDYFSPTWLDPSPRFFDALSARIGRRSIDPVEIRAGKSERHAIRIKLLNASDVEAVEDRGALAFANVFPSVDQLFTTTETRVEQMFLLADDEAPKQFAWSVELGDSITAVERQESGAIVFKDALGDGVLRIPAPFSIDAEGVRRPAEIAWSAHRLTLSVPDEDLVYPVLVDPAFEVAIWQDRQATQPGGLRHHALAYDALHDRTVLFGGEAYESMSFVEKGLTWLWNGTAWTQACTTAPCSTNTPVPRQQHALAYDSNVNLAVLFGGSDASSNPLQDTWAWNGSVWQRLCSSAPCNTNLPDARLAHSMAYDSNRKVTVLFGGAAGTTPLRDTWEWNGSSWTPKCTASPCIDGRPPARYYTTMAFDSVRNVTVLYGGRVGSTTLGDTWEWNGSLWVERCTAAPCSNATPGIRYSAAIAFDSARGRTVLYGGHSGTQLLNDTWEWNGSAWHMTTSGTPSGLWRAAAAFDSARGRTVMYGGNGTVSEPVDDTWEYHTRGGACSTGAQCDTGYCVDNVCCEVSSCGVCEQCDKGDATTGTCVTVTNGGDDSCQTTHTCNATGNCVKLAGQACTAGPECLSAECVDNTCCVDGCTTACRSCANASGTCTTVVSSQDDDNCDGNNTCDASGACKPALGQTCAAGSQCASGFCADGRCCENACDTPCRSCANAAGTCTTVVTNGNDDNCGGASTCDSSGDCKETLGQSCGSASECSSGYCVDGRCCENGCTTPCRSCANAAGTCTTVVSSADDDNCQGADRCDALGVCKDDLGGSCSDGSTCATGFCSDGVCCDSACSGACDRCDSPAGTCTVMTVGSAGNPPCAPLQCNGTSTACPTSCTTDDECVEDRFCDSNTGTCMPDLALATPCDRTSQCDNSFCAADEKVCCDSLCDGACVACTAAKKASGPDGVCGPVIDDTDPDGECPIDPGFPNSCGPDGLCQGGACRPFAKNTVACGTVTCVNASEVQGNLCTGVGTTCVQALPTDCYPFICEVDHCRQSCTAATHCQDGAFCNVQGVCQDEKANGDSCEDDIQCTNGHCVDGVCCNEVCGQQCEACNVTGSEGTCSPMVGAPEGDREPCDTGNAACGGVCNGTDRSYCEYPGASTDCGGTCNNAVFVPSTCNGAGECVVQDPVPCSPYGCNPSTSECFDHCTTNDDCATGAQCNTQTAQCAIVTDTCKDEFTVLHPNGTETSCVPYRCENGECRLLCDGDSDCAPGYECTPQRQCVEESGTGGSGGDAGSGGSTGTGGATAGTGGGTGGAGAAAPGTGGTAAGGSAPRTDAASEDGGCGCRTGRQPQRGAAWLAALVAVLAVRRRRTDRDVVKVSGRPRSQ